MNPKPRSDAVLLNLIEADKEKLREALIKGMSYADASAMVETEFSVAAGRTAMSEFYQKECVPRLLLQRADDAESAAAFTHPSENTPANFNLAANQAIQHRLYKLSVLPDQTPAEIKILNDILMRQNQFLLNERAIAVQETRVAITKRAADLEIEEKELARRSHREVVNDATAAKVQAEFDAKDLIRILRMRPHMNKHQDAVRAWDDATKNGRDAGPKPIWLRPTDEQLDNEA